MRSPTAANYKKGHPAPLAPTPTPSPPGPPYGPGASLSWPCSADPRLVVSRLSSQSLSQPPSSSWSQPPQSSWRALPSWSARVGMHVPPPSPSRPWLARGGACALPPSPPLLLSLSSPWPLSLPPMSTSLLRLQDWRGGLGVDVAEEIVCVASLYPPPSPPPRSRAVVDMAVAFAVACRTPVPVDLISLLLLSATLSQSPLSTAPAQSS